MEDNTVWILILVSTFCILGFVVFLILTFYNNNKSFASKLLAGIIFSLTYTLFAYLLYISKEYLRYPHFYRTPAFLSLCIAPLLYIYVRSSLTQTFWFKKCDFLLFIPAALYTAQFIPFYLLPANDKLYYIKNAIQNKAFGAREPEGLLPPGLGFSFRMIYSLTVIGATYIMLVNWRKKNGNNLLSIHQNLETYKWLFYLTIILSSTFLVLVISFIFQLNGFFDKYKISTLTLTFSILFITIYLLFKPSILYGLQGWQFTIHSPELIEKTQSNPSENQAIDKKRLSISLDQGTLYKSMIESHFDAHQPFLKQKYTVRDLSDEIKVPAYLISAFINQQYGKNFSEFINDKRVEYLIDLSTKEPDQLQQYTLEVLGQMSGFNSRSAFIGAVKRKTGKNPSEIFGK